MANSSLTRTVTASSATSYTVSFWLKINNPNYGSTPYLWSIGSTNGNGIYLFDSDRKIYFFKQSTSSFLNLYNGALRDTSAWYHVVWSVNSGTGTAYINGITGNSHSSIPALNDNTGTKISIHDYVGGGYNSLDCLIANFYFIDGQALTPSSFGQTDATTGIWKPKVYTGSYGTNGFFLKFENSASLGTDSSGNGNNFTVNGTPTQTVDTPSNNFATLNPLYSNSGTSFSNGNLTWTMPSAVWRSALSNLGVSKGKWYMEAKYISGTYGWFGICSVEQAEFFSNDYMGSAPSAPTNLAYGINGGTIDSGGAPLFTATAGGAGTIIGMALDLDNNYFYLRKDGTFVNGGVPTSGASGTGGFALPNKIALANYVFGVSSYSGSIISSNFGNGRFGTTAISSPYSDTAGLGKFQYAVPAGYYSLCTKNINSQG